MEILWWLAPAGGATALAMVWALWAGRPSRYERDDSDEAYARFAAALTREHPGARLPRVATPVDRSTGIAVRPSSRESPGEIVKSETPLRGRATAYDEDVPHPA